MSSRKLKKNLFRNKKSNPEVDRLIDIENQNYKKRLEELQLAQVASQFKGVMKNLMGFFEEAKQSAWRAKKMLISASLSYRYSSVPSTLQFTKFH